MSKRNIVNNYELFYSRLYVTGIISIIYSIFYGIMIAVSYYQADVNLYLLYYIIIVSYNISLIVLYLIFLFWVYYVLEIVANTYSSTTTSLYKISRFIIPVVNLYEPYFIITKAWKILSKKNKYLFIKLWWFIFILSSFINKISFIFIFNVYSIDSYKNAIFMQYLDVVFNIIYIFILFLFMKKINSKISLLNYYSLG